MEVLTECPICNGNVFEPFIKCTDHTVTKESFNIVSCHHCNFKFTNPRPEVATIGKYYESEDYISHSDTKKGVINKLYHFIKKIAIKNKINIINDLKTKNRNILDIGCGTGSFLGEITKNGWNGSGIEPNNKARETAIKNYNIQVLDENWIQTLPSSSFSIITMWHVLEHVYNLKKRVGEVYNLLEKDGYAVIAVPNYKSWDAKHYKEYWAGYDLPRHLYHFSPLSIKELFQEFNLNHFKSIPMKFDSYYVSLLSEKYKKSFFKYIRAFLIGWWSNIKAKKDAEKFSSVIYIFQKK